MQTALPFDLATLGGNQITPVITLEGQIRNQGLITGGIHHYHLDLVAELGVDLRRERTIGLRTDIFKR